ncbi:hypothetical protein SLEP1_g60222 [Rubroshorea leprosula]|uniref:Uncharacterized protein n=1 Tax=Rubroshorea leprosula TaxID=152421 RepID=A0AAV5MW44_9ROSI|nr:hypothetical protein SLEP1_g60222 [Rubroshorea leprosula]
MVSECECDKFRALCICGTRLMSARRLLRLGFGFWGVTDLVVSELRDDSDSCCLNILIHSDEMDI